MRSILLVLFLICNFSLCAQGIIKGRILNQENREPLPYAHIETSEGTTILTNIDGSFQLPVEKDSVEISISYIGFQSRKTTLYTATIFIEISLKPSMQNLNEVVISAGPNPANTIIQKALDNKNRNDPEKYLENFSYKSYTKFIVDNETGDLNLSADSTSAEIETILNDGRAYLSEKASTHYFEKGKGTIEVVEGVETAGFENPVYEVLALEVNPFSLYKNNYSLFKTEYASPLGREALENYSFKILDTIQGNRPAYMIYFKPKRDRIVAGLEGILYLDTETYAIQKATAQLLGAIKLQVDHSYTYLKEENIWFPSTQETTIRPGKGGKEIAIFGGSISVGAIQQKRGFFQRLLKSPILPNDLYLTVSSKNEEILIPGEPYEKRRIAKIMVNLEATERKPDFWETERLIPFTNRDMAAKAKVDSLIQSGNVKRKLQVKDAISRGYYPIGIVDLDISKIFKTNVYEGLRLGLGLRTNEKLFENFSLEGYTTYGFGDEALKYGAGANFYLNPRTSTTLKFYVSKDIDETGSVKFLKGDNPFSLIEPRSVNADFFYTYQTYWTGIEHQITSNFNGELRLKRDEITQIQDYQYLYNDQLFSDYNLSTAIFSFLWRPFSKYLSTPDRTVMTEKNFPQFTGQIEQSFRNLADGDFTFTRLGVRADHEIKRLDKSRTEFILEGNYVFGDFPLTHAFHSFPNNPNELEIFQRFSVAGRNSFETMYFNEFFSDRQAMFHVRHQLRPFNITEQLKPELVFISRFAIGDFQNPQDHINIEFDTLDKGFSEVGMELNKIFAGFGLSTAYRYGAYHLPTFKENFSFKFTLILEL
ncbi:DUF5686 and carboxypeptidase-like regulatory domain-containing protein [Gramella sp. AN32]|uniref:DUF5686 family protein n=1 Tax=Christiangramia antarctica TaxID=2058158 RepID=A0ABW5XAJ4_9FLAO|nr:DUF5686 and carboxypeptidase-like regulatory domain-containing protein [Gramella sp. AN32]MCM4155419.1 carboxypeptidase [Gramella sp. AN32]